jgi:hypothetical protein
MIDFMVSFGYFYWITDIIMRDMASHMNVRNAFFKIPHLGYHGHIGTARFVGADKGFWGKTD